MSIIFKSHETHKIMYQQIATFLLWHEYFKILSVRKLIYSICNIFVQHYWPYTYLCDKWNFLTDWSITIISVSLFLRQAPGLISLCFHMFYRCIFLYRSFQFSRTWIFPKWRFPHSNARHFILLFQKQQ